MKRAMCSRHILNMAALAALGLTLAACQSFRDAAGISKQSPDEFAITTKAPLVIPPDYNLRPPKPGAAPTNQVSPTVQAQTTLFNSQTAATASTASTYSQGEQELLAGAGATNADNSIRRQIATDNDSSGSDEDFSNQVLFWQDHPDQSGTPVNADAEQNARAAGQTSGTQAQPSQQPQQQDNSTKKDDSGWLDGLFDW